jgi:hypothetical protein
MIKLFTLLYSMLLERYKFIFFDSVSFKLSYNHSKKIKVKTLHKKYKYFWDVNKKYKIRDTKIIYQHILTHTKIIYCQDIFFSVWLQYKTLLIWKWQLSPVLMLSN